MELKDVIRIQRKRLGLTLEDIGKACGVGTSIVSKWERGEVTDLKRSSIANLATCLRVSPLVIMGLEEPDAKPAPLTADEKQIIETLHRIPEDKLPAVLAVLQGLADKP